MYNELLILILHSSRPCSRSWTTKWTNSTRDHNCNKIWLDLIINLFFFSLSLTSTGGCSVSGGRQRPNPLCFDTHSRRIYDTQLYRFDMRFMKSTHVLKRWNCSRGMGIQVLRFKKHRSYFVIRLDTRSWTPSRDSTDNRILSYLKW